MQDLLYFNELSGGTGGTPDDAHDLLATMVDVLREVARRRPAIALVSPVSLVDHPVAGGCTIGDLRKRQSRERVRFLMAKASRAPFARPLGSSDTGVEYLQGDREAIGLGAAHLVDGVAISLASDPLWQQLNVTLARQRLVDTSDGEVGIASDDVDVRHLGTGDHVQGHGHWLSTAGLVFRSGQELWTSREECFGNLRFLPRVESMLRGLERSHLAPVVEQLAHVNRAVVEWDQHRLPAPVWQEYGHITSDSASRKRLLEFVDDDGLRYTFDLHARFTPGVGRVYFRFSGAERKAVIASIGRKVT